jgi:hypothetical protein
MAFMTITIVEGLSQEEHRRAVRIGPRAVAQTRPIDRLMTAAGFEDVEVTDLTEEFATTAQAWFEEYNEHEDELRSLLGAEFDELCSNRGDMLGGLREGLLQRVLVAGTAR